MFEETAKYVLSMRHVSLTILTVLALTSVRIEFALAQGFELGAPGAVALGRASAVTASDDTPLALEINPAQLAGQHSASTASLDLILPHVCFERWGQDGPTRSMCSEARVTPTGSAALALRLRPDLSIAFGVLAPVAVAHVRFGGLVPPPENPTRYAVVDSKKLAAYLTLGLGYALSPRFRVGASFAWGFATIDNVSYSYAGSDSDLRMRLRVADPFVPRVSVGTSLGPFRGFSVASSFLYTSDFVAHGSIRFDGDVRLSPSSTVPIHQTVHGISLRVPQTHQFAVAARYARVLDGDADPSDRLASERFDIEADFVVVASHRVTDYVVRFPVDATLDAGGVPSPLPDQQTIPHRWRRQYVVRVGSDVTVVPERFAVRFGFAYDTDGAGDTYRNIDFTPFQRFTFSMGATLRVGRTDISLAYAHLHHPTQFVSTNEARLGRPLGGLADPVADAQIINAGVYRARYDLVALELTLHLGQRE